MQPVNENGLELPQPGLDSARHSAHVAEHIRSMIECAGGSISFAEFMQQALYAPGLGYYVAGNKKFGADGDFVTAPEISDLFGNIVASQCAPVLQQFRDGCVLELGAGSGALAVTMLKRLAALEALPVNYFILEVSAELGERQRERLHSEAPEFADRVVWLTGWPEDLRGVVVANEVADALPVERFVKKGDTYLQFRVGVTDEKFDIRYEPAPRALRDAIIQIEDQLEAPLADEYISEVSLGMRPWIADLAGCMQAGFALLFDYGVSRREYYAADRNNGWLRCHYRHRVHDNALMHPGIQDLTSWVDFTRIAEAGIDAGLDVRGFVSQAHFLLAGGLEKELYDFTSLPTKQQLRVSREVKQLTLPAEMGENFKCIGLAKGDVDTPAAFTLSDRRDCL